jgi:M6 family metalloprotease-like protein
MNKRKYLIGFLIVAAFLLLFALPSLTVYASPASPDPFIVTQPDGTTFSAIQWGDENQNGLETEDGYSITQDSDSGYWVYLVAAPDGSLSPAMLDTGLMIVGRDSPDGLKKHLRPLTQAEGPGEVAPENVTELAEAFDSPPGVGTHKVAVFLVGFPNATGRTDVSYWENLIFGGYGSLKDYYETVSNGAMTIVPAAETKGTVNDGIIGWLNLSAYYTEHPNPGSSITNANKYITKRALQAADSYINFASFDTNANGSIASDELHIIVIVAGFERSYGGADQPAVWAHNSDLSAIGAPTLDGKVVASGVAKGYYSQMGEFHQTHNGTLGVIAHEFGHDLRWPDLYDIDHTSNGVGNWALMGTGSWNGLTHAGDSPAFPDAWSRWYEGWMTPTTISGHSLGQAVARAETSPTAFLLRPNPSAVDWLFMQHSGQGEYFLVENRQLTSYDAALPGCGLLIWHVDETTYFDKYANANENRPLVKLMEADGLLQLKTRVNRGNAGDPYPGSSGNHHFSVYTTPNSKLYNGTDSFVRVTNISNCAATMTADMLYGYPIATLTSISPAFSDPTSSGITLTLLGKDFYSNSVVRWNGSDRTTYFVSNTKLQASIPASDLIALGGVGNSAAVTVFNPQPGGGVSATRYYDIINLAALIPRGFLTFLFNDFTPGPGFLVLMQQGFESGSLGDKWETLESGSGDYRWGRRECRSASGTFSSWAVGGGTDGAPLACSSNYPENINTTITYGPFSAAGGIQSGEVKFKLFLNSEPGFDYLWVTAGTGGSNEYGYKVSGNSGGWIDGVMNLGNVDGLGHSVIGYSSVWIRFRFTSDYLNSAGEGAFLDDIILRVCKADNCDPFNPGPMFPSLEGLSTPVDLVIEPVDVPLEP